MARDMGDQRTVDYWAGVLGQVLNDQQKYKLAVLLAPQLIAQRDDAARKLANIRDVLDDG